MSAPMLQHRHYKRIAEIIAMMPDAQERELVALHFANELKGTNPNYSRERFFAAAMGKPSNGRDKAR